MPRKKRRRHSPELKAKVALEAIKGLKTASELATEYEVHPVQISQWKRQLLDEVPEIFERGRKKRDAATSAAKEADLYEQVGRLKMELEWLKKKAAKLHG
jgi:transposase-like protein